MSGASLCTGEAVGDSIVDETKQARETSPSPQPTEAMSGNPEGLLTLDLPASSDYLLELIVHNLRELGQASLGAFLQKLLRDLTSVEVGEAESIILWECIVARRDELTEKLGRQVLLRTAAVDYFGELQLLRKPILLEHEELEKLRHNAATDPLTGLKNRRMFDDHLAREINRAGRYQSSFALLLMDLRRFKLANDAYGHAVGDEILRSVARASVETIRGSDIACRIGGDEFAILIPQAERASAEALAERIARKFEAYAKPLAPATPVGIDYGIAIFPEDGDAAARLFQTADKNLYQNKQKASRLLGEPVVVAWGAGIGLDARQGKADAARDTGSVQSTASSDRPPGPGLAGGAALLSERPQDRRKYERIPVVGARRIGAVRFSEKSKFVKVLDVSFGGVSLLMDNYDVPESFPARIQVPFLPDAELTLRRVYRRQLPDGRTRVGCSFTPEPRQDAE